MALVIACATQNIRDSAANQVKMKLKGSGNCTFIKSELAYYNNPCIEVQYSVWRNFRNDMLQKWHANSCLDKQKRFLSARTQIQSDGGRRLYF